MDEHDGSTTVVIYHASCSDGFAAAWVAHKVLPNAQYYPATHGQSPPDITGKDVYLFDFAYKRPLMKQMMKQAKSLVVFDHHKTAMEDLDGLPCCHFDLTKSGATLAWEVFRDRIKGDMPWILAYAEDHDLARHTLPFSREINAALHSYPFDFNVWDALERLYPTSCITNSPLVQDGKSILRFQDRLVEMVVQHATEVDLDGYHIWAANTSLVHGEVANRLAERGPFGIAWYKREDGKFVYALRSTDIGADVSAIAWAHGGGGHQHAAGFESTDMILREQSRRS